MAFLDIKWDYSESPSPHYCTMAAPRGVSRNALYKSTLLTYDTYLH